MDKFPFNDGMVGAVLLKRRGWDGERQRQISLRRTNQNSALGTAHIGE